MHAKAVIPNSESAPQKILSYSIAVVAWPIRLIQIQGLGRHGIWDRPKTAMATVNIREHSRPVQGGKPLRTTLGICVKKAKFASLGDALSASRAAPFTLNPYRCALCRQYHLTSRTKGMFVSRKCDNTAG